jgi:phosphonate transport system substrate-binding protein
VIGLSVTTTVTRSVVTQRPVDRTSEYLTTFCRAISVVLGIPANAVVVEGFDPLVENLRTGEIDFVWLAPVVALRAVNVGRALPTLLPVRQGVSHFHAALFAREGSPIREVKHLSRARVAWVDRTSAAVYLVIRAALRLRGLGFEHAFADERFYGTHDAVAKAVLRGDADVGAT